MDFMTSGSRTDPINYKKKQMENRVLVCQKIDYRFHDMADYVSDEDDV